MVNSEATERGLLPAMRLPRQCHSASFRAILTATVVAFAATTPADAGKRNPAPITYAGQTGTPEQSTRVASAKPARLTAPAPGEEGKRIAFRYPGQSGIAQAEPEVRAYASLSSPQLSAPAQPTAQMMTPNSFDAQATATRIETARQFQAVESEPLAALAPAVSTEGQGSAVSSYPEPTAAVTYPVAQASAPVFDETGISVVYGDEFAGLPTANGEVFEQSGMTAAHPTLPLPSLVQVVNLDTQEQVVVRVNDRGPFEDGASLQLSKRAASAIGSGADGRANVRIRYLGPAPVTNEAAKYEPQMTSERVVPASYATSSDRMASATVTLASVNQSISPNYAPMEPSGQGHYFVQLGSFSDISNAESLKHQLGSDFPVLIVPARVNGADYFRVRVGPLDTRLSAAKMRDDLADRGLSGARVVSVD